MDSYSAYVTPVTSMAPARPAIPPLTRNAATVTRVTLTPPDIQAASGLAPARRSRNPEDMCRMTNHALTLAATAMANPACRRDPGISLGNHVDGDNEGLCG